MSKNNVQISLISNRSALIIFGFTIVFTGLVYFYYARQISLLLPWFLHKGNFWVYLIGAAFICAGIAIIINKQITTLASLLLAILLFSLAIAIDLRGIFNKEDELKYLFAQALLKDLGLVAGAIIITNFEREKPPHRKGRHRRHSSRSTSESGIPKL